MTASAPRLALLLLVFLAVYYLEALLLRAQAQAKRDREAAEAVEAGDWPVGR